MKRIDVASASCRISCLAALALLVTACGGGGGGGGTPPPANRAPTVNAGADQLAIVAAPVTLVGTATDADGDTVTLTWTFVVRPTGSQATLSGASTSSPTFTPDVGGRYTLMVTASDGRLQSTDRVNVDANTRPEAIAGPDQVVDEGSTVTLDGRSSRDADGDKLDYAWTLTRPPGSLAALSDPASGLPSFQADVPGNYAASLVVNDGLLDSTADVTLITVNAVIVNSPPLASAGADMTATVGDRVTLDGTGSSDGDGDPLGYAWTLSGPVGSAATLDDAAAPGPSFDADVVGTYTATLIVNDGSENSAPDSVDVFVTPVGANRPPAADAGLNQSVRAGDVVQLDGSRSMDPDGDPLTYLWSLSTPGGSVATLSNPAAISPTFTADLPGTYAATLRVTDNRNASSQDSALIQASDVAVNTPPVAEAGPPQAVSVGVQVTLDGGASSDADGDPLTYAWLLSTPSGSTAALAGAATATPSFTPDVAGTYTATLIVSDGQDDSAPDSVAIAASIPATNTPPVADAGPDQNRRIGETVSLDGSGSSDLDGDALSYAWSLSVPAGSTAVLSGAGGVTPAFTPDVPGAYTATLVVDDGQDASAPDAVTVVVTDPQTNTRPVANAGPDRPAETGVAVQLDGRGSSDADGDPLSYAWSLSSPEGSLSALSDPASPLPRFTPDVAGVYLVRLVVNDGALASAPDTAVITAAQPPANVPPTASAGPNQSVRTGDTVFLDGSASLDPDGDPLQFSWSLQTPAGSNTSLSDPTVASPSFLADVAGQYTATLVVTDGKADSTPDEVLVAATDPAQNAPPVAIIAGNQSVDTGTTVVLDGSGSQDPDGDPLTFAWALNPPAGSSALLSDATTASPTFVADVAGLYTVTLVVNDGSADSAPAQVQVTASSTPAPNAAPVADAGPDQSGQVGQTVVLDGSASSDPDGDPLSFGWTLGRPAGSLSVLSDSTAIMPSFVPDIPGTYTAALVVSDGSLDSPADISLVTVNATNEPPVADAGPDQVGQTGQTITLDGSSSSDADGDPVTYAWTLARPAGSTASLSDPAAVNPAFTADVTGTYTATLVVHDGNSASSPDTMSVVISAANSRPVARAGTDFTASLGTLVHLDGSASSDADGDPLDFAWTLSRPAGSAAQLSGAATPGPVFTPDVPGVYTATLVVNDGLEASAPDNVSVTVLNGRPTADAGPDQSVNAGAVVVLDGSGSSDPDGQTLSFSWTLSKPAGSASQLTDAGTPTPGFVPDLAGTYTATLVVSDGTDASLPDSVNVLVNGRPVAVAGPDQSVNAGTLVVLDGSASSDPDGDPLSFNWVLNRPQGSQAVLSNPSSATPSFAADIGGIFALTLTVSDGSAQATDGMVVDVNTLPVADAGPDVAVDTGEPVTLDGTGSSDADGDILAYSWTLQAPAGSGAVLSDPAVAKPTFTADVEGSYVATLVVDDGRGSSAPDVALISATNPDVAITGTVTFDRVPHIASGGLDYASTFRAPARAVTVQAIQQGASVLATTVTDDAGAYALAVPPDTPVFLRVKAEMVRAGAPAWDVRVVDNTAGNALYTLQGTPFDSGASDLTVDLHAGSGWDAALGRYTGARAAAPFAVLDSIFDAVQLIVGASPSIVLPPVVINWSPLNTATGCDPSTFDVATGAICTTAYIIGGFAGVPDGQMFILGTQDEDTDEYDGHVITHEFAHYVEDRLGRIDSPGGEHTIFARLDPRLAFSEGWANAFSAMVTGDPRYKDAMGPSQAGGFTFNIESNSVSNKGWYNESSVHSVLYDIFDSASDGVDSTSAGLGPILDGIMNWQADTPALTTIFSFIPDLKSFLPADAANIDALLAGQSVVGGSMDIWASTETNDAGNSQDVLPVYTELAVGAGNSVEVCTIDQFGQFNRLSNRRFVRFQVASTGNHRIRVTGGAATDPDIFLFERGLVNVSEGLVGGQETLTQPLTTGRVYVVEVFDACMVYGSAVNAVCPNNLPSRTCLTVTVEKL